MTVLSFIVIAMCGVLSGIASHKKFFIKKQLIFIYPLVALCAAALYYCEFGISAEFFVGVALVVIYLFFSTGDIKTRKVSDIMHVLVFAAGFVYLSKERLLPMIAGAFILGAIPLFAAVIKPRTFGGADIKFLAAAGWLFGLRSGVLVMVIGLLLSIAGTLILSIVRQKKIERIPMIPYFCLAGSIIYSTL